MVEDDADLLEAWQARSLLVELAGHGFEVVAALKADGIAIIYVSHRMDEIYRLSDWCSVLRDGSYVGTLDRENLSAEALVKMMVDADVARVAAGEA